MPKCTAPLLSQSAVGPLAGILFRSGTYGPIISRTSSSPSIRTPAQSKHRGALRRAYDSWSSLTDLQRDSWNAARTGTSSALNAYTAAHIRLAYFSFPPPGAYIRTPDPIYILNPAAELASTNPDGTATILVYWTPPISSDPLINIFALSTYSGRSTPKPRKLIHRQSVPASYEGVYMIIPFLATTTWVRLEVIDQLSGDLVQQHLIRVTIPGDPGYGLNSWTPPSTI